VVITDAAAIAEARRLGAQAREADLARLKNDPRSLRYLYGANERLFKAHREEIVAAAKAKAADPSTPLDERVEAASGLAEVGESDAAATHFAAFLREPAGAERAILFALGELPPEVRAKVPDHEAWVLQQLKSTDASLRGAAMEAAGRLGIAQAAPALTEMAGSAKEDPSGRALMWAAKLAPSPALLDILDRRLVAEPDSMNIAWLLSALDDLAPALGDEHHARVAAIAERELRRVSFLGTGSIAAFEALRQHTGTHGAAALRRLASPGVNVRIREMALTDLADADPRAARELALASLDEPDLAQSAATVLGKVGKGSADAGLVARLKAAAQSKEAQRARLEIAGALREIGGPDAIAAAAEIAAAEGGSPSHGAQQNFTREQLAERLVAAGIIRAHAAAATRPADADEPPRSEPLFDLLDLAGVYLVFDTETDSFPPRHDRLLNELAAKSLGSFTPESASETPSESRPDAAEDERGYTVRFIHAGKLYRYEARPLGDWYDVPATLAAVNRALADAEVKQRFLALRSAGQETELIFADPAAFAPLAAELGVEIDDTGDTAMTAGKDFERQAIESIKRGELK
jgi:hypothetical protein